MFVLCKGDHVYTCNLKVASVAHKIEEDNAKHEKDMFISNNFKTYEKENEDFETVLFMINHIDDLVDILRNNSDKYEVLNVVHINDDLKDLFYQLKHIGYSPMIHFGAGIINSITCIFKVANKNITIKIKSQRPTKFTIEETVMAPDVHTLNNLQKVRHEFSSKILRGEFKSY